MLSIRLRQQHQRPNMTDVVTAAGGGAIGAAFMAGVQYAKSLFGNKNGGNKEAVARAAEIATLIANVSHLTAAVQELKTAANENQKRIGELAGNFTTLAAVIGKHYGK